MARILVIDDDPAVRATIKSILARRGHRVVVAESGGRGIAITEVFAFDVIVVDIFMPEMDGFETIKILHRCAPKVKVVAISGSAFTELPDLSRMAIELGAATCLRKPFRGAELIEAVEVYSRPADALRMRA